MGRQDMESNSNRYDIRNKVGTTFLFSYEKVTNLNVLFPTKKVTNRYFSFKNILIFLEKEQLEQEEEKEDEEEDEDKEQQEQENEDEEEDEDTK